MSCFELLNEGSGRIRPTALQVAMHLSKPGMSDQDFKDMIDLIRPNYDGYIAYRDLITKLLSNK